MKLPLAAVDATDCAIDGTVNCAKREDGRPALGGTDGVAVETGGGAAAVGLAGAAACAIVPGATLRAALGLDATTSG